MISHTNANLTNVPCAGVGGGIAASATGCPPAANVLNTPTPTRISSVEMKRNVGRMNAAPVSFTPRRLITARIARMIRHIGKVYGISRDSTEVTAVTPAEIPTAAVRM